MSKQLRARIGIFGVGLQAYWAQFDGLEARLTSYINELARQLETLDADIVNEGLVDTPEKAFQSGLRFKQADVDLVLLYATTYAVSSTILPVVRKAGVPVVVLNLSSEAAIPYAGFNRMNDRTAMTAEWLVYCSACSVPEISNVLRRSNIPFFQVTGVLKGDAHVSTALEEWVRAASVARTMYYNRLGLMG